MRACANINYHGLEQMTHPTVIYTTFAGRRSNLQVQFKYLDRLLADNEVTEVHLWDYTREILDSIWLKSVFGSSNPWIYCAAKHDYRLVPFKDAFGSTLMQSFRFNVRGKHDAHILLFRDRNIFCEIILGGWNNSKSVMRTHAGIVSTYDAVVLDQTTWVSCKLDLVGGALTVSLSGKAILNTYLNFTPSHVFIAGFHQCPIEYDLSDTSQYLQPIGSIQLLDSNKYKLKETPNKWTWIDFYSHYTPANYPNHVIIKADDDIVFIDTPGFHKFIKNRINNPDWLLSFPSIINNGVCAYYQQKLGLIPQQVGVFPYDTFQGDLWASSELCTRLHTFFIENCKTFVQANNKQQVMFHPIGDRISINFFAILSKDLHVFQDIIKYTTADLDDEQHLSITIAKQMFRRHVIDPSLVVSHLSFYKQVETGLQEAPILAKYAEIASIT